MILNVTVPDAMYRQMAELAARRDGPVDTSPKAVLARHPPVRNPMRPEAVWSMLILRGPVNFEISTEDEA